MSSRLPVLYSIVSLCILLSVGCSYLEQNSFRDQASSTPVTKPTDTKQEAISPSKANSKTTRSSKPVTSTSPTSTDASKPAVATSQGIYSYKHLPPSNQLVLSPSHPKSQTDIWQRIRDGYKMNLSVNNRRVRKHRAWFIEHKVYLNQVLERSEPYLYHIVESLEEKNLPLELALLPVVESAFDPFAVSRSKAAGLWQFIPSTGRAYGLQQTWWYDGRQDIIASTDAATTYLSRLHHRFKSWELALAAYNTGSGTLSRAIKKQSSWRNRTPDYWSLSLSNETTQYVPKLIAIAQIVKKPEQYRITLPPIPNKPSFVTTHLAYQVDLSHIANTLNLEPEILLKLNPGFKRGFSDVKGPHRFLVPIHKATELQAALPKLNTKQNFASWQPYKVKAGDTLSRIARAHDTKVTDLKQFNRLNSHFIRQGQTLLVPKPIDKAPSVMADNKRQMPKPAINTTQASQYPPSSQYQVKPGDSLYRIAKQFATSPQDIASLNDFAINSILRPGQMINLPETP